MPARYFDIAPKDYQRFLAKTGFYKGEIDGIEGTATKNATAVLLFRLQDKSYIPTYDGLKPTAFARDLSAANYGRQRLAVAQVLLFSHGFYTGLIDGKAGPGYRYAVEQWQNYLRGVDTVTSISPTAPVAPWPGYPDIAEFYGDPGTGHTLMELPYPMRIAWDLDDEIHRITIHKKCAESAKSALKDVLLVYGVDEIRRLKLDLFGGCYNNRNMRGGTRKSVHAYAAAIDFAPEQNQLRWGMDRAIFAQRHYDEWWKAWESRGWVSLGRERNYDWMHVQACEV